MTTLATWKCHKVVAAGKIIAIGPGTTVVVENAQGGSDTIECIPEMFTRRLPVVGDYYVEYMEPGHHYTSFSPGDTFENGYTKITPK